MEKTGLSILGASIVVSIAAIVSLVTSTAVASRAYLRRGEQDHRQSRVLDVAGSAKIRIGAHVESLAPDFVYTKLADLKVRMLGEATANARERAERIASGSGCRVGAVKEASAGVLQITPPWSTEVTSSGVNDTSSIEKDVTSVVHLSMMIEPR